MYVPKLDPAVARKTYPNDGDRRRRARRLVLSTPCDASTSSRFRLRLFRPCPGPTCAVRRHVQAPRIALAMRAATTRASDTSVVRSGGTSTPANSKPACARPWRITTRSTKRDGEPAAAPERTSLWAKLAPPILG